MLAAIKLGAVAIPAATLLTIEDLQDRLERGKARYIVTQCALVEKYSLVCRGRRQLQVIHSLLRLT